MSKKSLIVTLSVLFTAGAILFMGLDKVAVQVSCQDPRLFMDGIYYATVQGRKLTSHNSVTIYKRYRGNKVALGTIDVNPQQNGYFGQNVKLLFSQHSNNPLQGLLQADVNGEKISTSLVCAQR
jgi:hypothetical protein